MQTFFGIKIQDGSIAGMSFALLLAVVMGGLIGLEREIHGHPAGMRTHILVCLGSTLITLVSVSIGQLNGSHGDPARLSAQIVSGIGFLGAGAILREGTSVKGLTTAASVWTTAGIGIALGANPFYGQLAVITTVIVLFTLWGLNYFEDWIDVHSGRANPVLVEVHDTEQATAGVLAQFGAHNIRIQAVQFEPGRKKTRSIRLRVCFPAKFDRVQFVNDLSQLPDVITVDLD